MPTTNSIQVEFGAYLQQQPAIVTAVPMDRTGNLAFYYNRGPQDDSTDPYISFRCSRYVEELEVGGPPVIADADMEISCLSLNPDTAQTVAVAVKSVLRFQNLPFPMGPFTVLGTWISDTRDEEVPEYGLFRAVIVVGMQLVIR